MLIRCCKSVLLLVVLFSLSLSLSQSTPPVIAQAFAVTLLPDHSSGLFVENTGQFEAAARFQARTAFGVIWLADDAMWLTVLKPAGRDQAEHRVLSGVNIKLSYVAANAHPRLEPFNLLDTHVSYLMGSDSRNWKSDVRAWGSVRYHDLYPGIDLDINVANGRLTQNLIARSSARSHTVRLQIEGAERVVLQPDGLYLSTTAGGVLLPLGQSVTLNRSAATVRPLADRFFEVTLPAVPSTAARTAAPLPPAPSPYSTLLGGGGGESIAVDQNGDAYILGEVFSADFPVTPGAFDTTLNGTNDAFVLKLNSTGSAISYATFIGGDGTEAPHAIAVDAAGAAYITGYTDSSNYPTTPQAFDRTSSSMDAFVSKINATGTALEYSTYLGGDLDWDQGIGIALDNTGAAYVCGTAWSTDFPVTPNGYDTTYGGGGDMFVVKLNAQGSERSWGTFIGGTNQDRCGGIALDSVNAAYVTGVTFSSDYPTTPGAYDQVPPLPGLIKSATTVLTPTGTGLVYSTFLGGGSNAYNSIAVDSKNKAHVAFGSNVVKLNSAGSSLEYATSIAGEDTYNTTIAVDTTGSTYVAGYTRSPSFHFTAGAFDKTFGGGDCFGLPCEDAYVAKLSPVGTLQYASFLSGVQPDFSYGVAADSAGTIYVAGVTSSPDFPTTAGAFSNTLPTSGGSAFAAKIPITVDTRVQLPATIFSHPDSTAEIPLHYDNVGNGIAMSMVMTVSLGNEISYLTDTSGISPTVLDNLVSWQLPDLDFAESGQFTLRVSIPATAVVSARYPFTATILSTDTDLNLTNNHQSGEITVPLRTYLPIIRRSSPFNNLARGWFKTSDTFINSYSSRTSRISSR